MILRLLLGEAGMDARGLWISDEQQEWDLRIGNITGDLLRDAAGFTDIRNKRNQAMPTWGIHVRKRF